MVAVAVDRLIMALSMVLTVVLAAVEPHQAALEQVGQEIPHQPRHHKEATEELQAIQRLTMVLVAVAVQLVRVVMEHLLLLVMVVLEQSLLFLA